MSWKLKLVAQEETGAAGGPKWNVFTDPRPYVTVSGFAFDGNGRFAALHRSANVRSAANCWALPSGLHEVGYTGPEQFCIELKEELNLDADPKSAVLIGHYENIRPDKTEEGWHWFIVVYAVKVKTLETIVNSEPHKHDEIKVVPIDDEEGWLSLAWEPALSRFLDKHVDDIKIAAHRFYDEAWQE